MNIAKILKLADFLDSLPDEKFSMTTWGRPDTECGTVACVAGWDYFNATGKVSGIAAKFSRQNLELTTYQANMLYTPRATGRSNTFKAWRASPKDAAKTLRVLAATGSVQWGRVMDGTVKQETLDKVAALVAKYEYAQT